MDSSSPAKRRKTTPTTSVAVDASNTVNLTPGRNGQVTTPNRASFMSPTKASLARFNPGLLPRPQSAGKGAQRPRSQGNAVPPQDSTPRRPRSAHGGESMVNRNAISPRPATPGRDQDGGARTLMRRAGTASPKRKRHFLGVGISAAPRRRSRTPGQSSSPAKVSKPLEESIIAASPPEAANETQDVAQKSIDGQLGQELQGSAERRSARASQAHETLDASRVAEEGEQLLPLTPTQMGLAAPPEPPKGLLHSPSRRPKRKKISGVKSSPLRLLDPPLEILPKKPRRISTRIRELTRASDTEREAKLEEPSGEVLQKQRIRDELRIQLQNLQEDVALCEREIERDHESDSLPAPDEDTASRLISIFACENAEFPKPPPKPPPLSQLLSAFLPFSKHPPPRLPTPPHSIPPDTPFPSHRPIDLEDPLPYLQVFTPLKFRSSTTILPVTDGTNDLLEKHDISIISPRHLLTAKLCMTVNSSTHMVTNLVIQSLSSWAELELGSWIRERAKGDNAAGQDISGICWAIGRYWELCEKRAICWARCHEDYPEFLGEKSTPEKSATTANALPTKKTTKQRKPDSAPPSDHPPPHSNPHNTELSTPVPRYTLLQHLPRLTLLFHHPTNSATPSLLIKWHITFDWTGEAQSHISATAAFPASWNDADERGSLAKVGGLFEGLVERVGVLGAVRGVVGLLFEGAQL
ncbi:MAG: hypothetical protein M1830_005591 [Pleopsidium flavum]|nr:MAG: hypothetical protein M1830_005591 [Pleopsidium flavum]